VCPCQTLGYIIETVRLSKSQQYLTRAKFDKSLACHIIQVSNRLVLSVRFLVDHHVYCVLHYNLESFVPTIVVQMVRIIPRTGFCVCFTEHISFENICRDVRIWMRYKPVHTVGG